MVNPQYEEKAVQGILQKIWKEQGSVQLLQLFTVKEYIQLKEEIEGLEYFRSYLPTMHSYGSAEIDLSFLLPLVSAVVGKKMRAITAEAYQLQWKDYTLLHDNAVERRGIDLVLDFTQIWDNAWGGSVVYVDGKSNYTAVPVVPNMMFLMQRKKEQKFIQYVNYKAKGKRYIIVATCGAL